jgi:hypothetical protein
MPNRCSPDAFMSAHELRALRYLWRGLPQYVEEDCRQLLVRMGLAKVGIEGTLEITEAGKHRFTTERNASPPVAVEVAANASEGRAAY